MDKKQTATEILIFLVRHGKAEDPSFSDEDFTRCLTARGRIDCRTLANDLKQAGLRPEVLISSPAFRTAETARILSRSLGLDPDAVEYQSKLYLGRVQDYLHAINEQDNQMAVMLIGHNPDLGDLAMEWSGGKVNHFPTSGCAVFRVAREAGKLSPLELLFSRISR
jgi:phosphohistidine phosphatase